MLVEHHLRSGRAAGRPAPAAIRPHHALQTARARARRAPWDGLRWGGGGRGVRERDRRSPGEWRTRRGARPRVRIGPGCAPPRARARCGAGPRLPRRPCENARAQQARLREVIWRLRRGALCRPAAARRARRGARHTPRGVARRGEGGGGGEGEGGSGAAGREMAPRSALVVGGSGYLGQFLVEGLLARGWRVAYTYNANAMPAADAAGAIGVRADVRGDAGRAALAMAALENRVDVVVNCVAISQPRACEEDPEAARIVNSPAASLHALAEAGVQPFFVHISTDQVYAGTKAHWGVGDATEPVNEYGRSKVCCARAHALQQRRGRLALASLPHCLRRARTSLLTHHPARRSSLRRRT